MKKNLLVAALTSLLSVGAAHAVTIDPDGSGGDPSISVGTLDWIPGNLLVTATPGVSITHLVVGDIVQAYAQVRLGNFLDTAGNPRGGLQLNGTVSATNYEITLVVAVQAQVTSVSANCLTFVTVAGGANYFNIYYDKALNSNPLHGYGYADDVGNAAGGATAQLILSSTVLPGDVISSTYVGPAVSQLDGFGANNYPGLSSDTLIDGARLNTLPTFADANFFPGGPPALTFAYGGLTPYVETNPASCFWDDAVKVWRPGAGPNAGPGSIPSANAVAVGFVDCANSIGAVNVISGPDVIKQIDASSAF
jgi:hypothetical protein